MTLCVPIFRHADRDGHRHSKSDGSKCETRIATIKPAIPAEVGLTYYHAMIFSVL